MINRTFFAAESQRAFFYWSSFEDARGQAEETHKQCSATSTFERALLVTANPFASEIMTSRDCVSADACQQK